MSTILEADTIHDPVDGWVAVIFCPECDGAFGVQTDADVEVAEAHVEACSGHGLVVDSIKDLARARKRAGMLNSGEAVR